MGLWHASIRVTQEGKSTRECHFRRHYAAENQAGTSFQLFLPTVPLAFGTVSTNMTSLLPRRAGIILLLATAVLIFTGCLHLASTKAAKVAAHRNHSQSQPNSPITSYKSRPSQFNSSSIVEESENVLFDGVRRFIRTSNHSQPELIFMVLNKDKGSWGQETFKPARTFHDFLSLINETRYDLNHASLGIMTSSEEEYRLYKKATANTPLPRVTILYRKADDDDNDPNWWTSVPRGGRHTHAIQLKRRMHVATLRNEMMARTLHDEKHLFWIDSDIEYLSPGIVQAMLNHSSACDDAGIITARTQMGWNSDYDANSWAGIRYKNPASGLASGALTTNDESNLTQKHIHDLLPGTTDADIIRLDSVGGTILSIRASLVHQGLTFTPYNVIGTGWGKDGWDGLETEGMCYVARYLRGGGCYTLGGSHFVQHTNN